MTTYFAALDLGTTGIRAIIFNDAGEEVTAAYKSIQQYYPNPGWVEQNPVEIIEVSKEVLAKAINNNHNHPISCIGITNQRETTICWNKDTQEPVYNAIVWQCRRTADYCEKHSAQQSLIKEKTGLFLDPYFSGTKIKWILDNVPEASTLATNNKLAFGTVDTWIINQITQEQHHITDPSNASRTLLYNIKERQFDTELCNLFEIPMSILPDVIDSNGHFGTINIANQNIPIRAVLGDQQAALFGQGGWSSDIVKATYGTGIFIVANTEQEIPNTKALLNTIAWQIDGKCDYALEGSIFTGASGINWLKNNLNLIESPEETEALARAANPEESVVFIPALSGLGAPYWNPNATGLISGLRLSTTKADIVKALLDALAHQTQDVLDEINSLISSSLSELRVDGGITKNNYVLETLANITQLNVNLPNYKESTALGVAALAAITEGIWEKESFLALRESRLINPTQEVETRNNLRDQWKKAISLANT